MPGVWFEYEITVQDDDYTAFLTNVGERERTTSFHNTDSERGRSPGLIGVQAYPGNTVAWRHIRINISIDVRGAVRYVLYRIRATTSTRLTAAPDQTSRTAHSMGSGRAGGLVSRAGRARRSPDTRWGRLHVGG